MSAEVAAGEKRQRAEAVEPEVMASPMKRLTRRRSMPNGLMPEVVGDLVGQTCNLVCTGGTSLSDVADLIVLHDRTAAAIVDDDGALMGALTENDIVHAYTLDSSPNSTAGAWLQSEHARLPKEVVGTLTVKPTVKLIEAAALMTAQAHSDFSFRHLVVKDDEGGLCGILSSLDLTRALCYACTDEELLMRVGFKTANDAMKPKGDLPVCSSSATLAHVLQEMISAHQNCVVIADWDLSSSGMLGIVTPRDALRAFGEHVPLSTQVGHWLRGLQSRWEPRKVVHTMPLEQCAQKMADDCFHHLVVVSADSSDILGLLSSTDLAHAIAAAGSAGSPLGE